MANRNIIVIGASAGGLGALTQIVSDLPADLNAVLFVVLHISPTATSSMPLILSRSGPLRAVHPADGESIETGRIYVAPPDRHLMVVDGRVRLSAGPKENRTRPSVNPLFRTAAAQYGSRVIGVILSGGLDDGTAGLLAIKAAGGLAVVQDPADAAFDGMPKSAISHVDIDYVLPASEIGGRLAELVAETIPAPQTAEIRMSENSHYGEPGYASGTTCPECHGALWEVEENGYIEFKCRIGHLFSCEHLMAALVHDSADSLETTQRTLEEEAALAGHLAEQQRQRGGDQEVIASYERIAEVARNRAAALRRIIEGGGEVGGITI